MPGADQLPPGQSHPTLGPSVSGRCHVRIREIPYLGAGQVSAIAPELRHVGGRDRKNSLASCLLLRQLGGQLGARRDLELGEDVAEVDLDGLDAYHQFSGYLPVGEPAGC